VEVLLADSCEHPPTAKASPEANINPKLILIFMASSLIRGASGHFKGPRERPSTQSQHSAKIHTTY
jgi:hypothetical protein